MRSTISLSEAFPKPSESDWIAEVARFRRPKSGDATDPPPNATALPLHPRRVGARPIFGRADGQSWRVVERIAATDGEDLARQSTAAFAGGATGVEIVLASSRHPLGAPATAPSPDVIAGSLAGILPKQGHLRLDTGEIDVALIDAFTALAAAQDAELVLSYDPVALAALDPQRMAPDAASLRNAADAFDRASIDGAVLVADGRIWNAGGASDEIELGATLATFASHVRSLDRGDRIAIALAMDADQFRGIAKIRAMRLLIARVLEVGILTTAPPHIHAETAWRMLSARDPETNIVRSASAAFAAAIGGADSISVLAFDALGANTAAARRLARNTQIILAEEAHLDRVSDPSAGSGSIEAMTASFAEAAWRRFRAIEAEGGIMAALAEGALLRELAEAREARLARIARGDIGLIGVNAFRADATAATVKRAPVGRSGPLTYKRLASDFEAP